MLPELNEREEAKVSSMNRTKACGWPFLTLVCAENGEVELLPCVLDQEVSELSTSTFRRRPEGAPIQSFSKHTQTGECGRSDRQPHCCDP